MMDFSNALMHCSIIGYFMCEGNTKTPKQIYEDAILSRDNWQAKYNDLTDRLKGMKSGIKILEKIDKWNEKIAELEHTKDDEPLPQTAKSYLKKYYAYLKYGKWSASLDKGNKYTNKGKLAEEDSITLLSRLDKIFLQKNEERLQNEFLTGIPDILVRDNELRVIYIYDAKTSWDIETFFDNLDKDLNPLYWWQIQGYMALTGCDISEVSYCLVNTPETLLEGEKFNLLRRFDVISEEDPSFKKAYNELLNNTTFDDIPMERRRLKFIVERDEEAIQRIYNRIEKCREYLTKLQELHEIGVFNCKTVNISDSEEEMAA
jgi:hypothetical protein